MAAARILVVGAGAIGNEVIKNLALLGAGNLTVLDLDTIEHSNLSRSVLFTEADEGQAKAHVAASAARRLNPGIHVEGRVADVVYELGLGEVADADVVLGCLDNRLARRALNEICISVGTPWIDGAIEEMNGQVRLFGRGEGACYECLLREADLRAIQQRYSCPLLARDRILEGKVPTTVTSAAIVAAWQVQEAMKAVCGQPVKWGSNLISTGLAGEIYATVMPRKPGCPYHGVEPLAPAFESSRSQTWAEILADAGGGPIQLRHDLITGLECLACGRAWPLLGTLGRVRESDAACATCGATAQVTFASTVDAASGDLLAHTPAECQVPANDILAIVRDGEITAFRLR